MLLEKAAAWHLTAARGENRSAQTLDAYANVHKQTLAFLSEALGRTPTVADLTLEAARAWQVHLAERGLSGTSRYHYTRVLKTWTRRLAEDFGDVLLPAGDPLARLKCPRRDEKQPKVLTRDQAEILVAATATSREPLRDKAILLLLLESGLRVAEVCGIQQDQTELATSGTCGRVLVIGKGRKERYAGFGTRTSKALAAYLATRHDEEPWLFLSHYHQPLSPSLVRKLFDTLSRKTGIAAHPHTARHTFATLRAEAGVSVTAIQHQLGHSRASQTFHYIQAASRDVRKVYVSMFDQPRTRPDRPNSKRAGQGALSQLGRAIGGYTA